MVFERYPLWSFQYCLHIYCQFLVCIQFSNIFLKHISQTYFSNIFFKHISQTYFSTYFSNIFLRLINYKQQINWVVFFSYKLILTKNGDKQKCIGYDSYPYYKEFRVSLTRTGRLSPEIRHWPILLILGPEPLDIPTRRADGVSREFYEKMLSQEQNS